MKRSFGILLVLASLARANPEEAVCRQPSHGASCVCIATGQDWSLFLGCAHAWRGAQRSKPVVLDAPHPNPSSTIRVKFRLLAVDDALDLSLLEMTGPGAGPLPHVAPVAHPGTRPRHCWSIGYDEMKLPAQRRPATILGESGQTTWTRERPWHGRSGGALLDADTGRLVGIVSGYTGAPNHRETTPGGNGVYVSLQAITTFLTRTGRSQAPPTVRDYPSPLAPLAAPAPS